jgi:hypothetical protein
MKWISEIEQVLTIEFPKPVGIRVLLMPFRFEDVQGTLPFRHWDSLVQQMIDASEYSSGVGFLTIDESHVIEGTSHRRPGLHVDGWPKDGAKLRTGETLKGAPWGGGGWGKWGMLMASNLYGCNAYTGEFEGEPAEYGDCEHLRDQCSQHMELEPNILYRCGPLTVHESIPSKVSEYRQFIRLSMPSKAAWPESCTPNPFGIQPEGPIAKARPRVFTDYRDH